MEQRGSAEGKPKARNGTYLSVCLRTFTVAQSQQRAWIFLISPVISGGYKLLGDGVLDNSEQTLTTDKIGPELSLPSCKNTLRSACNEETSLTAINKQRVN
ncbi:hypothetical protein QLX08_005075 [Tetragonisca angustula]|uniref:Uncharacterized protein n=1 Tax=Tetragonisca angustula TaxID=166442 RepID=A0AAW1A1M4_9HYME